MVNACVVLNCGNSSQRQSGISMHTFPKNEEIRQEWINFCQNKKLTLTNTDHSRICGEHFTEKDFRGTRLKFDAIPTIKKTELSLVVEKKVVIPTTCSVLGCVNSLKRANIDASMFRVPQDPKISKIWLSFTRRKNIQPEGTLICSEHFNDEDIIGGKLKTGAFPLLRPHTSSTTTLLNTEIRPKPQPLPTLLPREKDETEKVLVVVPKITQVISQKTEERQRKMIQQLFGGPQNMEVEEKPILVPLNQVEPFPEATDPFKDVVQIEQDVKNQQNQHNQVEPSPQTENGPLKDVVQIEQEVDTPAEVKRLLDQISQLERQHYEMQLRNAALTKDNQIKADEIAKVKEVLTENQYKKIISDSTDRWWTHKEMSSFFTLFVKGPPAYKYLRNTLKYPLPATESLLKWQLQQNGELPIEEYEQNKKWK